MGEFVKTRWVVVVVVVVGKVVFTVVVVVVGKVVGSVNICSVVVVD
jgi:hypothetical protein